MTLDVCCDIMQSQGKNTNQNKQKSNDMAQTQKGGGEGVKKYEIFPCVIPKHKGRKRKIKIKPERVQELLKMASRIQSEGKLCGDRTYQVYVE